MSWSTVKHMSSSVCIYKVLNLKKSRDLWQQQKGWKWVFPDIPEEEKFQINNVITCELCYAKTGLKNVVVVIQKEGFAIYWACK